MKPFNEDQQNHLVTYSKKWSIMHINVFRQSLSSRPQWVKLQVLDNRTYENMQTLMCINECLVFKGVYYFKVSISTVFLYSVCG